MALFKTAILVAFIPLILKVNAAVSSTRNSSSSTFVLEEGDQMALEMSGKLLPPEDLSRKITSDLKLIRSEYNQVAKVFHRRKWIPGQLLSTRISDVQLKHVNESEFGPLENVESIDLTPIYIVSVMTFKKPYNPVPLAEVLEFRFGFRASPNTVYFDGDDISYESSNSTYIFKRGRGECKIECPQKQFWEFTVSESGDVNLVKEYGDPLLRN